MSVIVAVHDGERFIADALHSILSQTAPPDEVVVVDDGSTDGTSDVIRRFADGNSPVRCLRRDVNGGQASALNWGMASSRGDYLAFLDADDVWAPDKLARQLAAFAADPTLDVVYGQARTRILGGAAVEGAQASDGAVLPAYLPSAMLVKRAAFERVGDFDGGFRLGSVVDWYARSRDAGLVQRALDVVVYERRIHGDNIGIKRRGERAEYLRVVKAALDRRRRAAVTGPTAAQRGLLRALFAPPPEAHPAYQRWRQDTTFDPLDAAVIPLMPLLYFRLRELGIDDPVSPKLKGAYKKYWAQGSLLAARAGRALRLLAEARVPALAVGGLALLGHYGSRVGCRPTAVAELMIPRSWLPAAEKALDSGLLATDMRLRVADEDAFERSRARAADHDVAGQPLACVSADELLLEVCVEAAGRGFAGDLLWAADVVHLVRGPRAVDRARLAADARTAGAPGPLAAALGILHDAAAFEAGAERALAGLAT